MAVNLFLRLGDCGKANYFRIRGKKGGEIWKERKMGRVGKERARKEGEIGWEIRNKGRFGSLVKEKGVGMERRSEEWRIKREIKRKRNNIMPMMR